MGNMSAEDQSCPVCRFDGCDRAYHRNDTVTIICRRCGKFGLTGSAEVMVRARHLQGRALANLSGWIRENQRTMIRDGDLDGLSALNTPTVAERADKLLKELARQHPGVGETFDLNFPDLGTTDPSWIAVTWSESILEVQYLLIDYLHDAVNAIDGTIPRGVSGSVHLMSGRITPHGHQLLEDLRGANPGSSIGFCAMWFGDDVKPLWTDAIEPAIRRAGYEPKRIDQHEHVNRIDDEIVAMIRRSRFVVADFTGHRGGVYFESGFALGLGLRVIWLCREDQLKESHFDTRQYNFLVWNPGEYVDIAKRLQNRIEATLGRGPIR
jgi:hypothetical protein